MKRLFLSAAALLALATPAAAQRRADLAVAEMPSAAPSVVFIAPADAGRGTIVLAAQDPSPDRTVVRVLLGGLGWLGGAVVGSGGGLTLGDRAADDDGFDEALAGVVIGGGVGAALLASAPGMGSACPGGRRLLRSAAGSAAGTLLGLLLTAANDNAIWVVPVAASAGAGIGAEC